MHSNCSITETFLFVVCGDEWDDSVCIMDKSLFMENKTRKERWPKVSQRRLQTIFSKKHVFIDKFDQVFLLEQDSITNCYGIF